MDSCRPNATLSSCDGAMMVRANRDIAGGEQLTISYGPLAATLTATDRMARLMDHYCFGCFCSACILDSGLILTIPRAHPDPHTLRSMPGVVHWSKHADWCLQSDVMPDSRL